MVEEKRQYREGDVDTGDEKLGNEIPITAFMVVMKPDGTSDVILSLPGFPIQRSPSLMDVRDLASSVSKDVQTKLLAREAAQEFSRSMTTAVSQMSQRGPKPGGKVNGKV